MASSVLMAASSLLTWTLSQPGIATNIGAMRIASLLLAFATGGFWSCRDPWPAARWRVYAVTCIWIDAALGVLLRTHHRRNRRAVESQHAVSASVTTAAAGTIPGIDVACGGGFLNPENKDWISEHEVEACAPFRFQKKLTESPRRSTNAPGQANMIHFAVDRKWVSVDVESMRHCFGTEGTSRWFHNKVAPRT